ncbi:hypothetical protein D3C86_1962090 [compost metagenome]
MDDAANLRIAAIQRQMGRRIGGRFFRAFDHCAGGNFHHHHIFSGHYVILHAGRFDDHQTAFAIHRADVAPGKCHKLVGGKGQVCCQDLRFELL